MDILSFILGYQKGKSQGGGGTTETDIFPLQTVSGFVEDTQDLIGTYGTVSPISFEIKEGETYYVEWDGETYKCKGIAATLNEMSYVYLGNGSMLGYEGNNEPFAMIYLAGVGNQLVAFESTAPSHDIRIYQKVSGGVSADDRIKYVTFMYGETELITYPVIVGDTVKEPVSAGLIETPTKEPTESTAYSFGGWSLTDGGEVDSNALKNVTEDRTVYVAFTESARLYTVRFFDGDTLLKTEQVAYGGSSSYIPEKENSIFTKWEPEATNITNDIDCYAQWLEGVDFRFAEWSKISEVAQSGKADQMFNIGDTRTVTLTWEDGTTEDVELQIADMAIHTDSETERPLVTLITKNLISKTSKWASKYAYRNQYSYDTPYADALSFRTFLTETVLPALPEDLQAVLRQCSLTRGSDPYYIAPPHEHNIGFYCTTTPTVTEGKTYPIFTADNASRIKTLNGVAHNWATYTDSNAYASDYRKNVITESGALGYNSTTGDVSTTEAEIGACFLLFI